MPQKRVVVIYLNKRRPQSSIPSDCGIELIRCAGCWFELYCPDREHIFGVTGKRRMNIVHVVRQFHPAVGGFESVVQELASAQVAAGHRVRIITLNRLFNAMEADVLPARDVIGGAEVIRIPFFGSSRYPIALSAVKFIHGADIVHVHAIDFFFDYLAWTKPLHRKKLVVSTHGGFFHTPYAARFKRLYFLTVTRMSLAWYNAVVAVSVNDYELFGKDSKAWYHLHRKWSERLQIR